MNYARNPTFKMPSKFFVKCLMLFSTHFKFLSYICPTQEVNTAILNTNALLLFLRKSDTFRASSIHSYIFLFVNSKSHAVFGNVLITVDTTYCPAMISGFTRLHH